MEPANRVALLLFAFLLAPLAAAYAASVSELLGTPLKDLRGETAGTLEEVIVDVRAGRVAYLILGFMISAAAPARCDGTGVRSSMNRFTPSIMISRLLTP